MRPQGRCLEEPPSVTGPGPASPVPAGDSLCPMTWPWLQRGRRVRCVAVFCGRGHHARRPEPSKRVVRARGPFRARLPPWALSLVMTRGCRLRVSHSHGADTCRLHLSCLWALGLACGAPCFQDVLAGQAAFSPPSVSSQAGGRVPREERAWAMGLSCTRGAEAWFECPYPMCWLFRAVVPSPGLWTMVRCGLRGGPGLGATLSWSAWGFTSWSAGCGGGFLLPQRPTLRGQTLGPDQPHVVEEKPAMSPSRGITESGGAQLHREAWTHCPHSLWFPPGPQDDKGTQATRHSSWLPAAVLSVAGGVGAGNTAWRGQGQLLPWPFPSRKALGNHSHHCREPDCARASRARGVPYFNPQTSFWVRGC